MEPDLLVVLSLTLYQVEHSSPPCAKKRYFIDLFV